MHKAEEFFNTRSIKLFVLFVVMILIILGFVAGVLSIINSKRHLPNTTSTVRNRALRGFIISKDRFSVAKSNKKFKAKIYPFAISPDKENLFIKLFSIYSGMPEDEVKSKLYDSSGKKIKRYITLSKYIDASTAIHLKSLSRKLRRLRTFQPIINSRGVRVVYGLDIIEAVEEREYPFKDTLTPVIGYAHAKYRKDAKYKKLIGLKGLEKKYEKYLSKKKQDGLIKGKRDVVGTVIRTKSTIESIKKREDGYKLHLNVSMGVQKRVEIALDEMKRKLGAKEILTAVMDSKTGKILTIASSERYNPNSITKNDIPKLQAKFTEYLYEAGSVIKPITLSIALELKYVTPNTIIDTHNGRLPISRRYTITDDERFPKLTATDIIVHSSNVGITEIVWKMGAKEFRDGLKRFQLGEPSGIDLPRDLAGKIKSERLLKKKIDRANQAYGYGMQVTFAQLLKAYSVFNNDGVAVIPKIVDYLEDSNGKKFLVKKSMRSYRVISSKVANSIKKILKEVVKRGTGVAGNYEGLEVGGKTGTAHIYDYKAKKYVSRYNSSFYGFANDNHGNRYTIGVLVIEAKNGKSYFASKSAVPTFKKVVDVLVDLEYLKPKLTPKRRKELLEKELKIEKLKQKRREERARKVKEKLRRQREQVLLQNRAMKSKHKKTKVNKNKKRKIKKFKPIKIKELREKARIDRAKKIKELIRKQKIRKQMQNIKKLKRPKSSNRNKLNRTKRKNRQKRKPKYNPKPIPVPIDLQEELF